MHNSYEMITVTSAADIQAMIKTNKPRLFPSKADITITIPGLGKARAEWWQAKLSAQRNGCGCGTGMAFLLAAVTVYISAIIVTAIHSKPALTAGFFASRILCGFLIFFLAAGSGKVVGLALSQYRFKRLSTKLLKEINQIEGKA